MANYEYSYIEEVLKALGYEKNENSCNGENNKQDKCNIDPTGGASSNCCANLDLDIPGGFQDIDPIIFVTLGEIIGNIIAGKVPFNVANSISNILGLVGQIIETYVAQQLYHQSGPGRFYSPVYRNISNPFCSNVKDDDDKKKVQEGFESIMSQVYKLSIRVQGLEKEIEDLKNR